MNQRNNKITNKFEKEKLQELFKFTEDIIANTDKSITEIAYDLG